MSDDVYQRIGTKLDLAIECCDRLLGRAPLRHGVSIRTHQAIVGLGLAGLIITAAFITPLLMLAH